jgi:hypothetical protein
LLSHPLAQIHPEDDLSDLPRCLWVNPKDFVPTECPDEGHMHDWGLSNDDDSAGMVGMMRNIENQFQYFGKQAPEVQFKALLGKLKEDRIEARRWALALPLDGYLGALGDEHSSLAFPSLPGEVVNLASWRLYHRSTANDGNLYSPQRPGLRRITRRCCSQASSCGSRCLGGTTLSRSGGYFRSPGDDSQRPAGPDPSARYGLVPRLPLVPRA